ncbi:MAG: hypothetical protein V4494_04875 [Chlamydiota bacterium]
MKEILQKTFFECADKENFLSVFFDLKMEGELSFLSDRSLLQDSYRVRTAYRSRTIAQALITDAGELDYAQWEEFIKFFQNKSYILYPSGENDAIVLKRQLAILKKLPELYKTIKKFQNPLVSLGAENLIRESLQLLPKTLLTDAHIRRSVLAACLTLLRQNVGSCFATAPAILIQEEQVEKLLIDLFELLFTGKLKRVIAGTEFSVPLSPSWGWGDLRKKIDAGKIEYAPGFLSALCRVGIIDSQSSLEKKIASAASFAAQFKGRGFSIEELLRAILFGHFGSKMEEKEKDARATFRVMTDHPLLKAWEFTVASFSEAKMEFSRWNLYMSLGLSEKEKGGIGEVLYTYVNEKLEESNKQVQECQTEYESAFNQLNVVESLLRNASSEAEGRRLRSDYQGRFYHMQSCLAMRDRAYTAATNYSSLYSFMIKQYDEKFPEYFQEIYDPEMSEVSSEDIYDDTPAGFRLVYKHGRMDASSWSFIYNGDQFVDALVDFFRMTESLIAASCGFDEGARAVQEITTKVILHVRSHEFLQTAIERRNKPWAYISGGSLSHLLKIYYRREGEFTEEERWVESETELLIFLLDSLKNLPESVLENGRRMLMYTPTHACILEPFWELFAKGWREEGFTYTWVRDELVAPRYAFYKKISLSLKEQQFLIDQFAKRLPPFLMYLWQKEFSFLENFTSVQDFRNKMKIEALISEWDGFLFEMLPLTPFTKWKEAVRSIYSHPHLENALEGIPEPSTPWLSKRDLLDQVKACCLRAQGSPFFSHDIHKIVAAGAMSAGLAPPPPLIFADTNWPNFFFAFLVNPGTLSLELWRTDRTGAYGMPMYQWKSYVNGKQKKSWGVFTRPYQYR